MKRIDTLFGLAVALVGVTAHARDTVLHLPFEQVVARGVASGKLDGSIKFFLHGKGPAGGTVLDNEVVVNKKTNGVGKADDEACDWALMSALISLQQAAKNAGANTVNNIVSYYKKTEYKDPQHYECHAGGIVTGVALKGQLVKH